MGLLDGLTAVSHQPIFSMHLISNGTMTSVCGELRLDMRLATLSYRFIATATTQ